MPEQTSVSGQADTRERILAAALELFVAHGYQRTTLRQIAERLGVTKTAVLYHFPAKDRILAALGEPLVEALEAAVDRAAGRSPGQAPVLLVEGMLDAYLANRQALMMARHDLAFMAQQPIYHRLMRTVQRAIDVVAGPGADLTRRVRAMQAMSVLGDPVLFFPDVEPEVLRPVILAGVRAVLDLAEAPATVAGPQPSGDAGAVGAAAQGPRRAGRPRALRGAALAEARRLYRARTHTVAEIATVLGVSRATVYRHLEASGEH
jgi:AcrR family transcriptional regulator